ncbi:MAG TPA: VTT domain-containing protein [Gemmatimonadales bacterium]|nr:VTT domain-containing protein [Gemmatimonadales bacterium]
MIAGSVIIENFFPPSPSDVFVVLAAFLAKRGPLEPLDIFLVAFGFGVGGAVLVYWSSRRFGRQFFQGRLGRRLVTPGTFAAIEREYLRFGVVGIYVFRMLPAFRAVVAPFAGLVNLGPARTLIPITLACATWYGGLTLLGGAVGSEWESISATLRKLNRGLWILALIVLAALMFFVLRRRRESRSRIAELKPFDPKFPDRPAELEEGLPSISVEALDEARRARRERGEA